MSGAGGSQGSGGSPPGAGWPVPALILAVPIVYGLAALSGMMAAWLGIALMRNAGALPETVRLVELLTPAEAATGPHKAAHFALVGILFTVNGIVTAGLALFIAKWSLAGGRAAALPLGRVGLPVLAAATVALPVLHAASFVAVYALAGRAAPAEAGFEAFDWRMWAYPLGIVIAAPVAEEIVFRGWLYAGVAARVGGGFWPVALTALVWAGVHAGQGFAKALALVATGLALGWLRRRTGSLWPGIAGHMAMNAGGLAYMTWIAGG